MGISKKCCNKMILSFCLFVSTAFYAFQANAGVCFLPDVDDCSGAVSAVYQQTEETCNVDSTYIQVGADIAGANCVHCNGGRTYCKCPDNMTISGNSCVCNGNLVLKNGACQACISPLIKDTATTCKCESNYVAYNKIAEETCASCTDDGSNVTKYNVASCRCTDTSLQRIVHNGVTKCLPACKSGQVRDGFDCKCTGENENPTPKSDGTCDCMGGYERNSASGKCEMVATPECRVGIREYPTLYDCELIQPEDGCVRSSNGCFIPACDEGSEMFFDLRDCEDYAGHSCHFDDHFYCYTPDLVCDESQNQYSKWDDCDQDWSQWWKCVKNNSTGCYYPVCNTDEEYYDDKQFCEQYATQGSGVCKAVQENSEHPCYTPKPGMIHIACDDFFHDYGQYSENMGCVLSDMRLFNDDGDEIQLPQYSLYYPDGGYYLIAAELANMPAGTYTLYYTNAVKLDHWANGGWSFSYTSWLAFDVKNSLGVADQGICNSQGYIVDGIECTKKCLCSESSIMECLYDYKIVFRHPNKYATTQIIFYPRTISGRNSDAPRLDGTRDKCMSPIVTQTQWNNNAFIH